MHRLGESAHPCPDGRALARVAADGAAHRSQRSPACRPPQHAALRRLRLTVILRGRGLGHGHLGIRWIESGLLHRPAVALALVRFLLLVALAAFWIDVRLGGAEVRDGDDETREPDQCDASGASDHAFSSA